jgi:hypothetical protein
VDRSYACCVRRLHLFEFNDSAWVPAWFREYETDYLRTVLAWLRPFDPLAPKLATVLRESSTPRIVDLCSGAAGPLPELRERVARELGAPIEVVLTDRFPSRHALARHTGGDGGPRYLAEPVDATDVPAGLDGMRTLFDALHHFRPEDARRILGDARRAGVPVGAFEICQRTPAYVLSSVLIPFLVWLATPLVRPFSWRRLLLTYALPLLPLAIWWDGLVSHLRAYDVPELERLVADLGGADYVWEAGTLGPVGTRVTYLLGRPRRADGDVRRC